MTDRKAINELRRRQKAIGAAISALEEREEREKGCELCNRDDFDELVCYIPLDNGYSLNADVNFCPRCGRAPKGEDNETD